MERSIRQLYPHAQLPTCKLGLMALWTHPGHTPPCTGTCSNVCTGGRVCSPTYTCDCPTGQTWANGQCIDLQTDEGNCAWEKGGDTQPQWGALELRIRACPASQQPGWGGRCIPPASQPCAFQTLTLCASVPCRVQAAGLA